MRERLARFMQGRYGIDQFTNFLVFSALIMVVIEMFIKNSFCASFVKYTISCCNYVCLFPHTVKKP